MLDASALLALLDGDAGAEQVADAVLAGAAISTFNLAEVVATLAANGVSEQVATAIIERLGLEAVPFDVDAACRAGMLAPRLRERGLGLGVGACLALAQQRGVPALTADPAWAGLQVGISIRVVS